VSHDRAQTQRQRDSAGRRDRLRIRSTPPHSRFCAVCRDEGRRNSC
jgi:hypothetical protein